MFFITLLISAKAHANQILFESGMLNGQTISAGTTITVNPGQVISGTIFITAKSSHPENGLTPIGLNATWGTRNENVKLVYPHVDYNGGVPTTNIQVDFPVVDPLNAPLVAPLTQGLYHIIFGVRSECNQAHVMSATNWRPDLSTMDCNNPYPGTGIINPAHAVPVWGDGNDLGWDWTAAQFDSAKNTGQVVQQAWFPSEGISKEVVYGANWIAVKVVPVPAAVWLFVSGLMGVFAVARSNKHKNTSKIIV